ATSAKAEVPPELRGKVAEPPAPEGEKKPKGDGWAPDTDRVPDASRITPPVLKPGFRNGHDISLSIQLDAGVPVQNLEVKQHKATVERQGKAKASVKLDPADAIPNKDFVLRYAVVGEKPELAVLAHKPKDRAGYFMLMIQPKEDERLKKSPPRELFFLVDVSGSMRGHPTAQVKQAMKKFLSLGKDKDTFQIITFAGSAREVFEKPQPVDDRALEKAVAAVDKFRGGGGTHMLKGIKKCLAAPGDPKRVRIVIMLTDGYIGNEKEIIREVGRRCGDRIRFWTIGVGTSVNRYLIDGVAKQGGGMGKVLGLKEDPTKLVQEVMFRIHRAQLADIEIDWAGLDVYGTYPPQVPELWAGRPVILFARYRSGGAATIHVRGKVEGEPADWPVKVTLPGEQSGHDVLAKVWARKKIEHLSAQNIIEESGAVVEEITQIALDYRLMSRYTSFVAVDEKDADKLAKPARPPRRMLVPVPMPEGVSYEGVFGGEVRQRMEWAARGDTGLTARAMQLPEITETDRLRASAPAGPPPALFAAPAKPRFREALRPDASAALGKAMHRGRVVRQWGGGGRGGYAKVDALKEVADEETSLVHGNDLLSRVVRAEVGGHTAAATKALQKGQKLAKEGDGAGARAQFQLAYLLDAAAMRYRRSRGRTARAALSEIAKLSEKADALEKTVDLVLRDRSLREALSAVEKASGLTIRVTEGSFADARELLQRDKLRVTYLDLRGASVRQALDWLLHPMRLSWRFDDGDLVVSSARRTGGPWVYDISLIVIPPEQERKKAGESKTASAGRAVLKLVKTTAPDAWWYDAGRILVFGDPKTHTAVAKLLADFADPDAALAEGLPRAERLMVQLAMDQAAANAKQADERRAALERARVARAMADHSWALYADALGGELKPEHVAELEAAWSKPGADELLKSGSFIAVRSAWLIAESGRLTRGHAGLKKLLGTVRKKVPAALSAAVADDAAGKNAAAFVKALYGAQAARALRVDLSREAEAGLAGLTATPDGKDPVSNVRVFARALLRPVKEVDAKALRSMLGPRLRGDDRVVLGALAARRVGGETWAHFRRNARDILGSQRLHGSVVVLVNRLDAVSAKVLAMK
ncbi:MAG: VWA domain-containing protein, partial [Planctomycetota bacterium]